MTDQLRYDGKVALITGAGNGLGRSHALWLGSRGAKVVVNDLGGGTHGDGKSSAAADKVVAEIKALGGDAVANYDSVEDGGRIVQCALDSFGRIDIVINNAGILRDVSFVKMSEQDWDLIYRVHVLGAFRVTHAAWPHLREQQYGRVVMTTSAAGIYGNFGQANYSMAKLGLLGFANTLAVEGRGKNVLVNTIAPVAGSRMTETVLPPELIAALKPEFVTPLVAWLCHENCKDAGGVYEVGAGYIGKLRWQRTLGHNFRGRGFTADDVAAQWQKIGDFTEATHPADVTQALAPILQAVSTPSKGGNEFIDVDAALAADLPAIESSYDERDVSLYALGVGAAQDPLDAKELPLVYELNSKGFHVLPTFGVMPAMKVLLKMAQDGQKMPGLNYGFERILHGEQYTEVRRPLPPKAKLKHKLKIESIYDKGKNAVVVQSLTTTDESGEVLAYNELTSVVRGAGGWGGDRGPTGETNVAPDRAPDAVIEEKTALNQTLLYRLSGDWNPLHADPAFAKAFGFDKPILHGLCFFGYAGRHVIKAFCDNDPRRFKSIKVRFADSVFPGETLVTEMWKESETRIVFRMSVKERGKIVLSNAAVELYTEIPQAKAKVAAPKAVAAAAPAVSNEPVSADVFAAIGKYVENTDGLVAKVGTVYQWKLSAPDSSWVLDLKNGKGSCTPGAIDTADCTLELSDEDFMALCTGRADANKLYFGGKLKVAGNVMASQKLEFLKNIDPKEVAEAMKLRSGGVAPKPARPAQTTQEKKPAKEARSAIVFERLQNAKPASEIDAVLQFKVRTPERNWVVDTRDGLLAVREGEDQNAAAVFVIDDADLVSLASGKASAQDLFQRGKLSVDGDLRLAHKLGFLIQKN